MKYEIELMNPISRMGRMEAIPYLLNTFDCKIGVEVGVREGRFSRHMLLNSGLDILYGVDKDRHGELNEHTTDLGNRYVFVNSYSVEASKNFKDEFFDFIHIDAAHDYKNVRDDLHYWWSKLKFGGVFCGDDYIKRWDDCDGHYGIIQAVEEFVHDYDLWITNLGLVNKEERIAYGNFQGEELVRKDSGHLDHKFIDVPQWIIIK